VEERVRQSDENLLAYLRHAVTSWPEGEFVEDDGLALFAGAHANPHPYVNGAFRTSPVQPDEVLERANAFFGARSRAYTLWVREHADEQLEAAANLLGMEQRPPPRGLPGMWIGHRLEPREADAQIRLVATEKQAHDYLGVALQGWDMEDVAPDLASRMFLPSPAGVFGDGAVTYVAYIDGVAAAGCLAFLSGDSVGLYWLATAKDMRGRGLASAVVTAAVNAGFERGAVAAVGQCSRQGTPLFAALGFETVTHYRRYIARPSRR
jgi:GNAT superfamily N-acetyltransferase